MRTHRHREGSITHRSVGGDLDGGQRRVERDNMGRNARYK